MPAPMPALILNQVRLSIGLRDTVKVKIPVTQKETSRPGHAVSPRIFDFIGEAIFRPFLSHRDPQLLRADDCTYQRRIDFPLHIQSKARNETHHVTLRPLSKRTAQTFGIMS